MNEVCSTYRKPEAKPVERVTPHKVLTRANGMKGDDKRTFTALGYQMMDDEKMRRELEGKVQDLRTSLAVANNHIKADAKLIDDLDKRVKELEGYIDQHNDRVVNGALGEVAK